MFTDMVGYSSLIQENEKLGLELLDEHRVILRKIFPRYSGREIDTAGDAFFVEFSSALEATEAAIEIQTALHERNKQTDDRKAIVLRIGLHLGDVIHAGDQVQGDGVNIAARMEPLARPGAICVSEDVARQVHNKIELPIAPLGDRQLKNIHLPMNAYRIVMPWEDDFKTAKPFREFSRQERTTEPESPPFKQQKWLFGGLAVVATALLGWFVIYGIGPESGDQAGEHSGSVVAVFPFSVQGSQEYAYLGPGMVDLLSAKLDGAGDLRSIDPRAVLGAVEQSGEENFDPETGREIADRLGAGSFVLGNIVEVGGQFRMNATIYTSGTSAPSEQGAVEGDVTDIFSLVDGLATQLLVLDRTGPGSPVERLEEITTSSFDALKHYLQGVSAFRAARFQVAADELTLAVELDSTFALAWYQLSSTAEWLFDQELTLRAAETALRHKDRLSDRGRRLVEALHASKSGRPREALQQYRDFLTSYPDDVEAWYQLGELQFHTAHLIGGVSSAGSQTAWDKLLYFEPDQITALIHSTRLALAAGDFVKADSVSRRIFEIEPAAERNIEFRAHLALLRIEDVPTGQFAMRLRAADDAMLTEVIWSLGSFRDHPAFARAVVPFLTDASRSANARGLGHVIDGYLLAALGRIEDANQAFDRALAIGYQAVPAHRALLTAMPFRNPSDVEVSESLDLLNEWPAADIPDAQNQSIWYSVHNGLHEHLKLYLTGILEAMRGNTGVAERAAQRLTTLSVQAATGSLNEDLAYGVMSEIGRQSGDIAAAKAQLSMIERRIWYQFSASSSLVSLSRERFVEGLLQEKQGLFEDAIESQSQFGGHSAFDWIYIAPSHLRRAKIYEQLGDLEKAAAHYKHFVTLWADCDDEFKPLLEEAKNRLGELSTSDNVR
jgi:tetratricopeptide (TPR) repeat protein/TolB-like protein